MGQEINQESNKPTQVLETTTVDEAPHPSAFFEDHREQQLSEQRVIRRISFRNLVNSFMDAFNLDRGIIYTLVFMFTNPGKMARAYLTTGRRKFVPPFRLLIVTTTLSILVLQESESFSQFQQGLMAGTKNPERAEAIMETLNNYRNLFFWLYIPLVATITWLINRKSRLNYAENVVLHTYMYSITNLLFLVMGLDRLLNPFILSMISSGAAVFYFVFAYKQFFQVGWGRSTVIMVSVYILTSILYTILIIALAVALSDFS